jgi:ankyrin repeat protein
MAWVRVFEKPCSTCGKKGVSRTPVIATDGRDETYDDVNLLWCRQCGLLQEESISYSFCAIEDDCPGHKQFFYRPLTPDTASDWLLELAKRPVEKRALFMGTIPIAVESGDMRLLETLLERGVLPDSRFAHGRTALCVAAEWTEDRTPMAELLLARGADPRQGDDFHVTPLHCAAARGCVRMVETLLKAGADPLALNASAESVLHWATVSCDPELGWQLIQLGVDVNGRDVDGSTPLHTAATKGRCDFVRMLLEQGADANAMDKTGKTARMLAADKGHAACLELLPS